MTEVEKLIEIYKKVEDAGLMVIAGKKDSAELMVSHDVVPVVRYKDCKHREVVGQGYRWCKAWERLQTMGDDGFCCFGERSTTND